MIPSTCSTHSHLVLLKLFPWRPVQFSVTVTAYIVKQSNLLYLLPIISVATMHSNTTLSAPAVVSILMGGRRNDKCRSTASAGFKTNCLMAQFWILQFRQFIKVTFCESFYELYYTVNRFLIIQKYSGTRGGTPLYGLYRYVPRNRVWFLEVLDP